VILVDTAGIRKRGHVDRGVEQYSVLRAMRAIARSDVAVLVIDATEPPTAQDAHIAGYVWDASKGLVLVVNKWDLVVPKDEHTMAHYTRRLRQGLQFVHDAPIVFTSALTRQRVRKILDLALEARDERAKRVSTGRLNATIQDALRQHQPASYGGKLLKVRYVTQTQIDPPTFVFFVNDPTLVHFSYRRFLENQLREQFGFTGTAIRMFFRSSREAPVDEARSLPSRRARQRTLSEGGDAAASTDAGAQGDTAAQRQSAHDSPAQPASADGARDRARAGAAAGGARSSAGRNAAPRARPTAQRVTRRSRTSSRQAPPRRPGRS
jgi:GTP-binding protein